MDKKPFFLYMSGKFKKPEDSVIVLSGSSIQDAFSRAGFGNTYAVDYFTEGEPDDERYFSPNGTWERKVRRFYDHRNYSGERIDQNLKQWLESLKETKDRFYDIIVVLNDNRVLRLSHKLFTGDFIPGVVSYEYYMISLWIQSNNEFTVIKDNEVFFDKSFIPFEYTEEYRPLGTYSPLRFDQCLNDFTRLAIDPRINKLSPNARHFNNGYRYDPKHNSAFIRYLNRRYKELLS